jgi:lipopolysaccharide exporter
LITVKAKFYQYWKSVVYVLSAGILAQIFNFLFSPIISRLYTPESIGQYTVISAYTAIIVPICFFRYELTIPVIKDNLFASKLIFTLLKFGILIGSLLTCILFFLINTGPLSWALFITVFFGVIISCMTLWCSRCEAYSAINYNRLGTVILNGTTIILLASVFPNNPINLLLGFVISNLLGLCVMIYVTHKSGKLPICSQNRNFNLKEFINEYSDFPKYNLPMTVVDQFSSNLPLILVFNYFGDMASGQLAMCNNILRTPISILGTSIAQVFFMNAQKNLEYPFKLRRLFFQNVLVLGLVSIILIITISLFGPWLFSSVMGSNWKESGEMAKIMVWATGAILVCSPTSILPSLLKLQKTQFLITLCFSILKTMMLFFGCWFGDFKFALIIYVLAELLGLGTYMIWIVIKLKHL